MSLTTRHIGGLGRSLQPVRGERLMYPARLARWPLMTMMMIMVNGDYDFHHDDDDFGGDPDKTCQLYHV